MSPPTATSRLAGCWVISGGVSTLKFTKSLSTVPARFWTATRYVPESIAPKSAKVKLANPAPKISSPSRYHL